MFGWISGNQTKKGQQKKEVLTEKKEQFTEDLEVAGNWAEYRTAGSKLEEAKKALTKQEIQQEISVLYDLQIRRDFLYASLREQNIQFTYNLKPGLNEQARLVEQILQLETAIKKQPKEFSAPLLLQKLQTDTGSIAMHLADHFQLLFAEEKKPEKRIPLVELKEEGVRFLWPKETQAAEFATILLMHKINAVIDPSSPNDVVVPHADVKKLLLLAQFRPYNIGILIKDWYEARKLSRALLLSKNLKSPDIEKKFPVEVKSIAVAPDKDHDRQIIKATLSTQMVAQSDQKKPHHVVFLIDASTKEAEMAAFALQQQMGQLPPETLVTVLSTTENALLCDRKPAKTLLASPHTFNIKALARNTGDLDRVLPSTAIFVRQDPKDLRVSDEEIKNTTFCQIVMTAPHDPDALVAQMRKSTGFEYYPYLFNQLKTINPKYVVSYGLEHAEADLLPVFFSIFIGDKKEVSSMRRFSHMLDSPLKEIDRKAVFTQFPSAFQMFNSLIGRVPECFVRLTYEDAEGEEHALQSRQINLFNHYHRDVFFEVPKGAKNIQLFVDIDDKSNIATYKTINIEDEKQAANIIDQLAKSQFRQILLNYYAEEQSLKRRLVVATNSDEQDVEANEEDDRHQQYEDETDKTDETSPTDSTISPLASILKLTKSFDSLKGETQTKLAKLKIQARSDELKKQIQTAHDLVSRRQFSDTHRLVVSDDDLFIKEHLRENDLAQPLPITFTTDDLIQAIENEQHHLIEALIPKVDVEAKIKGQAPLSAAVNLYYRLYSNSMVASDRREAVYYSVQKLLNATNDMCIQDAKGNTALHVLAKCVNFFTELLIRDILKKASEQGTLAKLLAIKNAMGESIETVLATKDKENSLEGFKPLYQEFLTTVRSVGPAPAIMPPPPTAPLPPTASTSPATFDEKDISSEAIKSLMTNIEKNKFDEAKKQLSAQPKLINSIYINGPYRSTPLVYALVRLEKLQTAATPDEKQIKGMRQFMSHLIQQKGIDLCFQDAGGNSALHRAIYLGEFALAREILAKAEQNGTLKTLVGLQNKSWNETFFDNLYERCSPFNAHRNELLTLLSTYGIEASKSYPERFPGQDKLNHEKAARLISQISQMTDEKEITSLETALSGPDYYAFRVPEHDKKDEQRTGSFKKTMQALKLQKIKIKLLQGGESAVKTADEDLTAVTTENSLFASALAFFGSKSRNKGQILEEITQQHKSLLKACCS